MTDNTPENNPDTKQEQGTDDTATTATNNTRSQWSRNIALFPRYTHRADNSPTAVLRVADQQNLQHVLVLGITRDGRFYDSASTHNVGYLLWLIELFRLHAVADSVAVTNTAAATLDTPE